MALIFIIHFTIVTILISIGSLVWLGDATMAILCYIFILVPTSVFLFRSSVLWVEYKKLNNCTEGKLSKLTGKASVMIGAILGILDIVVMTGVAYILYLIYNLIFDKLSAIGGGVFFVIFEISTIVLVIKILQKVLCRYTK